MWDSPGMLLTTRSKETSEDFLEQPGLLSELWWRKNIIKVQIQSQINRANQPFSR